MSVQYPPSRRTSLPPALSHGDLTLAFTSNRHRRVTHCRSGTGAARSTQLGNFQRPASADREPPRWRASRLLGLLLPQMRRVLSDVALCHSGSRASRSGPRSADKDHQPAQCRDVPTTPVAAAARAPHPELLGLQPQHRFDRLHQHPLRPVPGADRPQATLVNPSPRNPKKLRRVIEWKRLHHARSRAHERYLRGSVSPPRGFVRDFPPKLRAFGGNALLRGQPVLVDAGAHGARAATLRTSPASALYAYNPPHERPDDGLPAHPLDHLPPR